MKNVFLLFFSLFTFQLLQAQVVYEDFEGGTADVAWTGLNGIYNGVVANPAPDAVNNSGFVGSYTNANGFAYNFALGTLGSPANLTQFNLIKMKVWSPVAPAQVLFKFEGGGNNVESIRNITVANEWVEYSFDVTGGAGFTMMDKILVAFNIGVETSTETFYFDDIEAVVAREDYETFENGANLPWQGLDGFFDGPVTNPDPNSVNSSDSVGLYVKSGLHSYSLLLADRGIPFDMSTLNQFHLQVHAQAATQVLLKLEGTGGESIERTKNIGLANEWQEYTFDFSDAADFTTLSKVILFFDPGVEMSADTYYFDNLYALPEGACKNVTLNPDMIDDFECNRNATYVNGWDSLSVVSNPTPDAVNSSTKVGQYVDPQGEQWATLLIDFQDSINLSTNNQLKVKIWSPRVVPILFKLEGGSSPAKEVFVDASNPGHWVEYTIDFSGEASANHKKLGIFFNAGQDPQAGDVYYIDDIRFVEKTDVALEDFEDGTAFLPWEPLDQQALLHGSFEVVDNPDPLGINTSLFVGKYTKGSSAFSTVTAVAPGFIDISTRPQYNLDVYAPSAGTVTFQLGSVSQGNKEVERDITVGGEWLNISFDFSSFQSISDWESINIIFNPGVAEEGAVFYFDNLTQSETTVDPCEGTVTLANIIDDFECQRNYEFGSGAAQVSVVGNPLVSTTNASTLVGLYADPPNDAFAALCVDFPDGIDLSSYNQLSFQMLSDAAVPVLLKLEGGTAPGFEVWTASTTPGEWETITGDFSSQVGMDHKRACIFINAGVEDPDGGDYYIDNLQFAHAPFTGCLINFDDAAFISTEWKYFPADDSGDFELVPNPDPSGINTSPNVGKAVEKASSGQPWQGMYTDLPAPIQFGADKIVKMKIYSPQIATVTMKIENSKAVPPGPGSGDLTVANTKVNEWEELTWDFSTTPIIDDGDYVRVTLIWDINNLPAEDVVYYFDDVSLTGGECGTTSTSGPVRPTDLSISPNPVTDELSIEELGRISRLDIHNLFGQKLASVSTGNANSANVNVGALNQGTYILTGYSSKGELLAMSRFVKL
ncbi:MAG TPA: T9SS type A sorting domain-containing protein [Saprospiraceae bacterium]|nr:T9SS type A sorting domain-containing protein [Saprospiraceae bacterium]